MLYPSHFPKNFLDLGDPGRYPFRVMMSSLEAMKKRTGKDIRPWLQGFWYTPDEIDAQLRGVVESGIQAWTVWHPSGKYAETFRALEMRMGASFPEPVIYPLLADLRGRDDLVMPGRSEIINLTCYRDGYTILSLDESLEEKYAYATIMGVVSTLDESIADRILAARGIALSTWASRYTKDKHIVEFIVGDLDLDPCRMRAEPIYVDWDGTAAFSRSVPPEVLARYEIHSKDVQPPAADIQRRGNRAGSR
jgi:hypothetical protein